MFNLQYECKVIVFSIININTINFDLLLNKDRKVQNTCKLKYNYADCNLRMMTVSKKNKD